VTIISWHPHVHEWKTRSFLRLSIHKIHAEHPAPSPIICVMWQMKDDNTQSSEIPFLLGSRQPKWFA
jgi:hypothetical protein